MSGRKSRLQREPDLTPRIAEMLVAGHYANVVCDTIGVSESAFYSWLERGEAVNETLAEAEDSEAARLALDDRDRAYAEFADTIKTATGQAEERGLKVIRDAMPETWQAAAWFLERRYPKRWGRFDRFEAKTTIAEDPLAAAAASDKEVKALVNNLIARIAGEDEPGGSWSTE